MRNDVATTVGEQLDGVRKGGGHDRYAGGDGFDKDTRGDLFPGVIREDDHIGGRDERPQRGRVLVVGLVSHHVVDAEHATEAVQTLPVRLALTLDDLGMLEVDRVQQGRARAEYLGAALGPDRAGEDDPVTVDVGRHPLGEIPLVLDDAADGQLPTGPPGYLDGGVDSLVGMDAAEDDQAGARIGTERKLVDIDAVMHGGDIVEAGSLRSESEMDTNEPGMARVYAGMIPGPEKPCTVVSIGARQCSANASGNQSRWLCTRSNCADRANAWETCKASQTRPSIAGSVA